MSECVEQFKRYVATLKLEQFEDPIVVEKGFVYAQAAEIKELKDIRQKQAECIVRQEAEIGMLKKALQGIIDCVPEAPTSSEEKFIDIAEKALKESEVKE
jgi:hypothetical protein